MTGDTMLVALKNWRSRLSDAEYSKGLALLTTVELALNAGRRADCDDALQQFHAALTDRRSLSNEEKIAGLGPQFRNSIALTAAESRNILGSAMNGFRHIEGDP